MNPTRDYVHYCGYCRLTTEGGQFLTCNCLNTTFDREHLEAFLNTPHNVDKYEDTSTPSAQSPSASDEMDSNGDSGVTDSGEYTLSTSSEADVNEDQDVAREVSTS